MHKIVLLKIVCLMKASTDGHYIHVQTVAFCGVKKLTGKGFITCVAEMLQVKVLFLR